MEFGHGNTKEGRSTSLATDLWIKTFPNALKSQIDPKANLGYFWWKFSKIGKIKENFWGMGVEIRSNPWKPLLLIPYDVGWPDLHGLT